MSNSQQLFPASRDLYVVRFLLYCEICEEAGEGESPLPASDAVIDQIWSKSNNRFMVTLVTYMCACSVINTACHPCARITKICNFQLKEP